MKKPFKQIECENYPTKTVCPLKGGEACDGRLCAFAIAKTECEYETEPFEDGPLLDWETITTTWTCAAVPVRGVVVDTRVTTATREHEG